MQLVWARRFGLTICFEENRLTLSKGCLEQECFGFSLLTRSGGGYVCSEVLLVVITHDNVFLSVPDC